MEIILETDRLWLRRFTLADVDHLVALDGDPEVMRYVSGGVPTSRREIETDMLPAFLDYYERGADYGFWAAVAKPDRRFLGWFHLRPAPDSPPDEPELGYRLRREAWGAGYATEGARALIDKSFRDLGARRVVAHAFAENVASHRVMAKAGLSLIRAYRLPAAQLREMLGPDLPGHLSGDAVEYASTRADWEARRLDAPGPA